MSRKTCNDAPPIGFKIHVSYAFEVSMILLFCKSAKSCAPLRISQIVMPKFYLSFPEVLHSAAKSLLRALSYHVFAPFVSPLRGSDLSGIPSCYQRHTPIGVRVYMENKRQPNISPECFQNPIPSRSTPLSAPSEKDSPCSVVI